MANKVYVGDVGTAIVLNLGVDVTDAIGPELRVKKPDGSTDSWVAATHTIDGKTTFLRYITVDGDLNLSGRYKVQAHLTVGGWTGLSETVQFTVTEDFK